MTTRCLVHRLVSRALSLPTFSNAQAHNAGDYTDIWNYLNQSGSDQRGYTW